MRGGKETTVLESRRESSPPRPGRAGCAGAGGERSAKISDRVGTVREPSRQQGVTNVARDVDDRALLAASRAGASGFETFYRRHCRLVLSYLAQRTPDAEEAADLTAETFASALLAVQDHRRELPNAPAAWLITIANRKLIDARRRGRVEQEARRRLGMERLEFEDSDLEQIAESRASDVICELAEMLPAEELEALRMRVVEDGDYQEIAQRLACTEQTARKRVSRALARLRASLTARGISYG